jgi:predicted transcriptional regulator
MEELLKSFGLSIAQTKVYQALLEQGPLTMTALAKNTGLHRSSCQEYVRALQQLGFVNESKIAGKFFYQAEDPDKFVQIIRERQFVLEQLSARLRPNKNEQWKVRVVSTGQANTASQRLRRKEKGKPTITTLHAGQFTIGNKETILTINAPDLPAIIFHSHAIADLHRLLLTAD